MPLILDDNQTRIVDAKRKPPGQRPQYYNAIDQSMVEISADFEAFLILHGASNSSNSNSATVQWLDQASTFGIRDRDRDALAAQALTNDINDASNSQYEIAAFVDTFAQFRALYNLTGFESVAEAGLLLTDMQRPMQEAQTLADRLVHRIRYCTVALDSLSNGGVTPQDQDQIDSWYSPLSAY